MRPHSTLLHALLLPSSLALLASCGPKEPPAPPVVASHPLDARPEVGLPPLWTPPAPEVLSLANGADAWLLSRDDLPLISLRLWVPGGTVADPSDHPGLTHLADNLLLHGAGARDAAAFASHSEQLAIDLDVSTWEQGTVVSLDCHVDRLDEGLDLMADMVLRPRFDAADVTRERDLQIAEIERSLDDPRTVASWVSNRAWYGDGHPSALPGVGTPAGLDGLSPKALRASWTSRFIPDGTRFLAAGAVDAQTLTTALDARFGAWKGPPREEAPLPPAAGVTNGPRLVFVEAAGSSQTVLRVVLPGWKADDPQRVAANLGIIVLGGTFTSRLNRLLREEKGYTYGARARAVVGRDDGLLIASTNVRGDVTGDALADLIGELEKISAGIDAAEMLKAQGSARTDAVESMGQRASIAAMMASATSRDEAPDALAAHLAAVGEMTEVEINAALKGVDLSRALIVVVGDLAAVREAVEAKVPGTWEVIEK